MFRAKVQNLIVKTRKSIRKVDAFADAFHYYRLNSTIITFWTLKN